MQGCFCVRYFVPEDTSLAAYSQSDFLLRTPHFGFAFSQPGYADRGEVYLETRLGAVEPPGKVTIDSVVVIDAVTNEALLPIEGFKSFKYPGSAKEVKRIRVHMVYTYTSGSEVKNVVQDFDLTRTRKDCIATTH